MNNIKSLLNLLPQIERMKLDKVSGPLVYIGAVGFEDRTFVVLEKALQLGKSFDQVIAIEYRPFDDRNKKEAFKKIRKIAKSRYEKEEKEVIGFLIGYFHEETIEITDIIIPEQTANRTYVEVEEEVSLVNALIKSNKKGTNEVSVGWFHSHPGFKCFLSATDIETQMYWQRVNPRNIALVYDPVHTEVKAFRIVKEENSFREITIPIETQN